MKEILFKNIGAEQPCRLEIVFETRQEAIDFFAFAVDDFGTKDYEMKFVIGENDTIQLKMKSPKNLTQSIVTPFIKYNPNDFYIFTQVPINKELFVIMAGNMEGQNIVLVQYIGEVCLEVRGYQVIE